MLTSLHGFMLKVSTVLGVAIPEERADNAWTEGVAIWVAVIVVSGVGMFNLPPLLSPKCCYFMVFKVVRFRQFVWSQLKRKLVKCRCGNICFSKSVNAECGNWLVCYVADAKRERKLIALLCILWQNVA